MRLAGADGYVCEPEAAEGRDVGALDEGNVEEGGVRVCKLTDREYRV